MFADWIIAFMYGCLMFFLDFFPSAEFLQIPSGIYNIFRGIGKFIDMNVLGSIIAMMISIYAAYGAAFLINWIIKRFRGG